MPLQQEPSETRAYAAQLPAAPVQENPLPKGWQVSFEGQVPQEPPQLSSPQLLPEHKGVQVPPLQSLALKPEGSASPVVSQAYWFICKSQPQVPGEQLSGGPKTGMSVSPSQHPAPPPGGPGGGGPLCAFTNTETKVTRRAKSPTTNFGLAKSSAGFRGRRLMGPSRGKWTRERVPHETHLCSIVIHYF